MNEVTLGIKEALNGDMILVNTSTNGLVLNQLYAVQTELQGGVITGLFKVIEEATPETGLALLTVAGTPVEDKTVFHQAVLKPVTIIAKEV